MCIGVLGLFHPSRGLSAGLRYRPRAMRPSILQAERPNIHPRARFAYDRSFHHLRGRVAALDFGGRVLRATEIPASTL